MQRLMDEWRVVYVYTSSHARWTVYDHTGRAGPDRVGPDEATHAVAESMDELYAQLNAVSQSSVFCIDAIRRYVVD